jgi:EAL domain-containing protein (putative c-di-GMP-specific phosphodiesterase class I)
MSFAQTQEAEALTATAQLEAMAQRLLATLGAVRVTSLSFHDEDADVLWLNEGVLGPDEHAAVSASMEIFTGEGAPARHECDLGDGRIAVTWRARRSGSSLLGMIMAVVDQRALADHKLAATAHGVQEAVDDFSCWLAADISATQQRLRALPDLSAAEPPPEPEFPLALVEYIAPPPKARTPAPATAAAGDAPPVNRARDKHFSALRAQPIVLHAQQLEPITDGSRIRRFEVLLRTGSDHGRTQAPVAMLEAATRKGLGSVVDRRVVTDLIVWLARTAAQWRSHPIAMTVNLSSTSLVDPHFLKFLELCLAKAALPRGIVGFELDSALCASQPQRSREFAEVLAALGCKVVLDDFSLQAGQMDLLSLKGLRMLKLHPGLTNSIATDKRRQALVSGIARMAHVQGLHTCVKAVETREQLPLLTALKVDFAQGFAFSLPRPLAEIAAG